MAGNHGGKRNGSGRESLRSKAAKGSQSLVTLFQRQAASMNAAEDTSVLPTNDESASTDGGIDVDVVNVESAGDSDDESSKSDDLDAEAAGVDGGNEDVEVAVDVDDDDVAAQAENAKQAKLKALKEMTIQKFNEVKAKLVAAGKDASTLLEDMEKTDDDDVNYNEDVDGETSAAKTKRAKRSYQPSQTSHLGIYLDHFRAQNVGSKTMRTHCRAKIEGGHHWFPPTVPDPVGRPGVSAKSYYLYRNATVYAWNPFKSYCGIIDQKKICCVRCKAEGTLQSKGWHYRPAFMLNSIAWILHRRLECQDCSKTFAEIDPRFLSQLPTRVAERFEFVTTVSGPALHISMLYMMLNLMTKSVTMGIFASAVNEVYSVLFSMDHCSYSDSLRDLVNSPGGLSFLDPETVGGWGGTCHHDMDEYGLPRLTRSLLEACFFSFMEGAEPYMQNDFQARTDESCERDDTFKYVNRMYMKPRRGQVCKAVTNVLSGAGFVNISRFRFTVSHEEIRPVLKQWKLVRENDGNYELLRSTSDNPKADRNEMERIFTTLLKNVKKFREPSKDLPRAALDPDKIVAVYSKTDASNVASALMAYTNQHFEGAEKGSINMFGPDVEWNPFDNTREQTHIVGVSLPRLGRVYAFHLTAMGVTDMASCPPALKRFLNDKRFRATNVNVGTDLARLEKIGVQMTSRLELRQLSHKLNPGQPATLQHLCRRWLGLHLDKSHQLSDWQQHPLPDDQLQYVGLDVVIAGLVSDRMLKAAASRPDMILTPEDLCVGREVQYVAYGKVLAQGVVTVVGNDLGRSQKWGKLLIGAGKALVRLTHVFKPSEKPQFDYEHESDPIQRWTRSDTSMGDLFGAHTNGTQDGPMLAFRTSSLRVVLSVDDDNDGDDASKQNAEDNDYEIIHVVPPVAREQESKTVDDNHEAVEQESELTDENRGSDENDALSGCPDENDRESSSTDDDRLPLHLEGLILDLSDEFDEDDDSDEPFERSRQKGDLWHDYHALPLSKKSLVRKLILALVIHATTEFVEDDFKVVVEHVESQLGYDDWREHFRHNREFWRRRVRMIVAQAKEHAARIAHVRNVVMNDPTFKKHVDEKVAKWFDMLERNAKEGYYSSLGDVSEYRADGVDSNGLQLWLRGHGSVRCENYHRVIKAALGSWGVGIKLGHYLLVLLAFRYNINTGVRRNGEHNFGHPYKWFIDRIQDNYQDMFNIRLFLRHRNMSHFKGIPGFIAVGVGPLSISEEFVRKAQTPHADLKGDARFLAEKMGVECPPLPVSGKDETKIFTASMLSNPTTNNAAIAGLCKQFLAKSNGVTIFPKTVSMIKAYLQKWQQSQLIKQVESDTKDTVKRVIDKLHRTHAPPIVREEQNMSFDVDGLIPAANFVAPAMAPLQEQYIPAPLHHDNPRNSKRRCFYLGFCTDAAEVCGGYYEGTCANVKSGSVKLPEDPNEFKRIKDEKKKELKRDQARAARKAKKRKKAGD